MKVIKTEVYIHAREEAFRIGDNDTANMIWHYLWEEIGREIRGHRMRVIAGHSVMFRDLFIVSMI